MPSPARKRGTIWFIGGAGPGAHGRLDIGGKRIATVTERLPERWQQDVSRRGHGIIEQSAITNEDAAREHLLMNLRLAEGIDLPAYRARWNTEPNAQRVAELSSDGFLRVEDDRLIATPKGRLVLNKLIAEIAD
jgi:coproporphyrinogen III oxidase-like Fe-S oxidoreductase